MMKNSVPVLTVLLASTALADLPPENVRNFVSCPIVRDTTTVPCWLSEYEGELYYLGIQTDISSEFHPPYLGHQVIVEGTVTDKPRICGGIVLEPVKISVVAELDRNCETILPVDERYSIDFNPRPPGPSGGRLAFQGTPARVAPPPMTGEQEFSLYYYHDGKVEGRNSRVLSQIVRYAQEIDASMIEITGHQGGVLLSSGVVLDEKPSLSRQRAEEVAMLLSEGGLSDRQIKVSWSQTDNADGIEDWKARRTDVKVIP